MIGALNPQFWWSVARATGIVAWVMTTASIAWGLTLSGDPELDPELNPELAARLARRGSRVRSYSG